MDRPTVDVAADYARLIWRRRRVVVAAAVGGAVVALILSSRQTPIYASTSIVRLGPTDDAGQVASSDADMAVAKGMGEDAPLVTDIATRLQAPRIVAVRVEAMTAEAAAEAATLYAHHSGDVLQEGVVANAPVRPRTTRDTFLGLFLGLVLSAACVVGRDMLDDSVRSIEDIEAVAGPVRVVGAIPVVRNWRPGDGARLANADYMSARAARAYDRLAARVQTATAEPDVRLLQVVAPVGAEGTTTTVANLGAALADARLAVTVADCDLRRPRLHEFFGLDNHVGFVSVLVGDQPLSAARQVVETTAGTLDVVASGPLPPNPEQLLGTVRAGEVIGTLRAESDVVVIDGPPALDGGEALVLATRVDAVLLVATCGVTGRRNLAKALEALASVDAPLLGIVANAAPTAQQPRRKPKTKRRHNPSQEE